MKVAKVWLCRNSGKNAEYVFSPLGNVLPRIKSEHSVCGRLFWWRQDDKDGLDRSVGMCAKDFQRLFPQLKLKPGEGPRKVDVTAKFTEEH